MAGGRIRLGLVSISVLALAGWLADRRQARTRPRPPRSQASTSRRSLPPTCHRSTTTWSDATTGPSRSVATRSRPGRWRSANTRPRAATTPSCVPLRTGRDFTVTVEQDGEPQLHRYYVRCLPNDFPTYTFTKSGPVSPQFFSADDAFAPIIQRYAMIFDNDGVPIWWYHLSVEGPQVLSGRQHPLVSVERPGQQFEIHRLDGRARSAGSAPAPASGRRPRPAAAAERRPTSSAGTPPADRRRHERIRRSRRDATVLNAELQEVGPQGHLLWDWKSQDHITLRRDRPLVALHDRHPGALRLRHRALELDRAGWQRGDRLLPATRRRLQDQQEHRRDRLEAGRYADAPEPHGDRRPAIVHPRRPARRARALRRDADRVRQPAPS